MSKLHNLLQSIKQKGQIKKHHEDHRTSKETQLKDQQEKESRKPFLPPATPISPPPETFDCL
jgi:hypothetical protein